jgi:hypothetical protein
LRSFQPTVDVRVVPAVGHWAIYEDAPTLNAMLLEMLVDASASGDHHAAGG